MKNDILAMIYETFDEMNRGRPAAEMLEKSERTVILGRDGKLDSLGLVNLIVALEEKLNDRLKMDITLADERAMSQESSPFKSVTTLLDYISQLIKEKANA